MSCNTQPAPAPAVAVTYISPDLVLRATHWCHAPMCLPFAQSELRHLGRYAAHTDLMDDLHGEELPPYPFGEAGPVPQAERLTWLAFLLTWMEDGTVEVLQ